MNKLKGIFKDNYFKKWASSFFLYAIILTVFIFIQSKAKHQLFFGSLSNSMFAIWSIYILLFLLLVGDFVWRTHHKPKHLENEDSVLDEVTEGDTNESNEDRPN